MPGDRSWAIVRLSFVGFHRWPNAPAGREYLTHMHRHVFNVEARVQTFHDDREIEFHDLRDQVASWLPVDNSHMGSASCEAIAAGIMQNLTATYGPTRSVLVSVFEDGENGALLQREATA